MDLRELDMTVVEINCANNVVVDRDATQEELDQIETDLLTVSMMPEFQPLPPYGVLALVLFLTNVLSSIDETIACCGFSEEHLEYEALCWEAASG